MAPQRTNHLDRIASFLDDLPADVRKSGKVHRRRGSQEFSDSFLAFELYKGTGRNIESIGDQINACYDFHLYDGCAVLSRRLLEMLLILSYKKLGLETRIRGADGHYLHLSGIVKQAKLDSDLDLSRNARGYLDKIVERGNLSAHTPLYNALKRDLDEIAFPLRVLVQELMHKAGKHQ